MNQFFLFLIYLALLSVLFVGCVPGGGKYTADHPAGFFTGIWHGWIAPLSLIFGLFDPAVRIYEPHNTGWGYDFGFYIAVIAGFGGLALRRRKKSRRSGSE